MFGIEIDEIKSYSIRAAKASQKEVGGSDVETFRFLISTAALAR